MLRSEILVVAVASLTLVLVKGDDFRIPHVLWYSSFAPALAEDFMQWMKQGGLAVLE